MANKDIQYSQDGNWQVELEAFKTNLFFYKAVGATVKVRHKETRRKLFGLGSRHEAWVERPVGEIRLTNVYQSTPSSDGTTQQVERQCRETNRSECDCREWAAGVSVTIYASADTGLPDLGETRPPSPMAKVEVQSVRSQGWAFIENETVSVIADAS